MARLGMDVDEVERVGGQLAQQANNLTQAMNQISSLVNQAVGAWDGNDSRQFAEMWNSRHKPALTAAASAIEDLGRAAKDNARQQRDISN